MACILFVDDDPYTLETLHKAVEIFGHQALLASSGEQALTLAVDNAPDLIMTDMMLPDMNGLALINRLREEPAIAKIPIIMLSASPEIDTAASSLNAGAEAYLNKPVRLQSLLDIIQRYTLDQ